MRVIEEALFWNMISAVRTDAVTSKIKAPDGVFNLGDENPYLIALVVRKNTDSAYSFMGRRQLVDQVLSSTP